LQNESHTEIERKAKETLLFVMQRMASAQSAETSTTTIQVANEEIKGKIIGKEGRNIRSFEKATGVTLIVDDTPGAITLSCFDSVRRNVAKVALEKLIADGRIQPARIEELTQKATEEVEKEIQKRGEEAALEVGVPGVDPKLIHLLGRLHYRTSFGQSVLKHSLEMAHLAGMLAAEVGADVQISRVGALFHDIGKAVDHEVLGTHVEIGRKILAKFNIDNRVIQAMQSHHEEYPFETPESIIVQVVDALSGGRPGARRGTIENYVKRLEDLEKIANSFDAVEKSYAISAGREVRVFVKPEMISDVEAIILAKKIATEIEKEMKYPGEIKVNVIRETRAIEYAK
ncbi:MAG: ribonuclease Y, partial [Candidatus Staskawiczbacteria bacterium]|nr:ribonuclease Y [Candidatus Staskawiczbacteria bacterium]